MKEWFNRDAVPKPEYPKVRWAELSEMPVPCFAQIKYDGELTYILRKEDACYTVNKWGRSRTDYPITDFANDLIDEHTFVGELYVLGGDLYEFLRSRKDFERLRVAIFDVVMDKPYYERWEVIKGAFFESWAGEEIVHLAEGKLVKTRLELEKFFSESVRRGFEGIVCRDPQSRYGDSPFKRKKVRSADVVVLGISKDSKRFKTEKGMIGSLLCECLREGKFLAVGRVGGGFSNEERKALYKALMEFKTGEDERYIYVRPALVLEVTYQEVIQSKEFDVGFTWRHPTFRHIRFEKEAKEEDVGLESQFPNF